MAGEQAETDDKEYEDAFAEFAGDASGSDDSTDTHDDEKGAGGDGSQTDAATGGEAEAQYRR